MLHVSRKHRVDAVGFCMLFALNEVIAIFNGISRIFCYLSLMFSCNVVSEESGICVGL